MSNEITTTGELIAHLRDMPSGLDLFLGDSVYERTDDGVIIDGVSYTLDDAADFIETRDHYDEIDNAD